MDSRLGWLLPRLGWSAALAVGLALGACDGPTRPAPQPTRPVPPTPPTASTFRVSGTVFEHTSTGPRPGAFVPLVVRSWGRSPVFVSVTSDGNGRYEAGGLPGEGVNITIFPPLESDYRAPCPTGTSGLSSDGTIDVHVVSTPLLASAGAPESLPRSLVIFAGVVVEYSQDGLASPVAGAAVDLTNFEVDPNINASTLTDNAGRYFVCAAPLGSGADQQGWLRVSHEAFQPVSRKGFPGTFIDFVVVRK